MPRTIASTNRGMNFKAFMVEPLFETLKLPAASYRESRFSRKKHYRIRSLTPQQADGECAHSRIQHVWVFSIFMLSAEKYIVISSEDKGGKRVFSACQTVLFQVKPAL